MVKRNIEVSPEVHKQNRLKNDIKDMMRSLELGIIPKNPTRSFEVGERVILGALGEVYVREIHENGMFYVCEAMSVKRDRDKPPAAEYHVNMWLELYKYGSDYSSSFSREDKYYIRQLNSAIDSLLHMVYASHAGIDFNVEYQRDHVWTLDDKVSLIDSIFNNVEIGKFIFVQLNEATPGKYYQILDGKQRLTALCEFFEDRFPYKGVYFSEMSGLDKHTFRSHSITYGFLENPNQRSIYETFIKLNTCGRPMDHKHIDKVKKLLEDLK
jgi:hypothetical protein